MVTVSVIFTVSFRVRITLGLGLGSTVQVRVSIYYCKKNKQLEHALVCLSSYVSSLAAAHHLNYARAGRVYWQQMEELPITQQWLNKQFQESMFLIRQSDRLWAGLSTDVVIE